MNVSVLLATYNGEKYLKQQIDSILNQTYTDFRLYISDDGSKDGTLRILNDYVEKYPSKIILLSHHEPTGAAAKNFFYLLKEVDSDLFLFSDQYDVWDERHIEILVKKYLSLNEEDNSKPICVHADLSVVDSELNILDSSMFRLQKLPKKNLSRYFYFVQNNVTGCALLINKKMKEFVFLDEKKLNESLEKILMHDIFFASIASLFGMIYFVDTPVVFYRQHGRNVVGAKNVISIKYMLNKWKTQKKYDNITLYLKYAEFFRDYFSSILLEKDDVFLKQYSNIRNISKFKRVMFLIKNNALKYGFFRNINFVLHI